MYNISLKNALVAFFLCFCPVLFSQNVGINITGVTPSTNAILDLNTGNGKNLGLIIPRVVLGAALTTFNPPMAHAATGIDSGIMVFNWQATNQPIGYYYWTGTTWVNVSGGGGSITASNGLTMSSATNVILGGTLTQATSIAQATYGLTITGGAINLNNSTAYTTSIGNGTNALTENGNCNLNGSNGAATTLIGTGTTTGNVSIGNSANSVGVGNNAPGANILNVSTAANATTTGNGISMTAQTGAATFAGGAILLQGGTGGTTGAGGTATVQAGTGGGTNGIGGNTVIQGGSGGITNSNGGNVNINGGVLAGTGTAGAININTTAVSANNKGATNIGNATGGTFFPQMSTQWGVYYSSTATGQLAQTGAGTTGQALVATTGGAPSWGNVSTSGTAWQILGNTGTTDDKTLAGNFLGDVTTGSLSFRVANNHAGRIDNTGNSFFGYQAGNSSYGLAGGFNTAVGYLTLSSATNSGYGNVALGYEALQDNTIGYGNVGIGYQALLYGTSAVNNFAGGNLAMGGTTVTGGANVGIGYEALYSNSSPNNVAIGSVAMGQGGGNK